MHDKSWRYRSGRLGHRAPKIPPNFSSTCTWRHVYVRRKSCMRAPRLPLEKTTVCCVLRSTHQRDKNKKRKQTQPKQVDIADKKGSDLVVALHSNTKLKPVMAQDTATRGTVDRRIYLHQCKLGVRPASGLRPSLSPIPQTGNPGSHA